MGRLDDLILLESAGQLPANMQKDLDTLRAAGHAPAKPGMPTALPEPSIAPQLAPQGQGRQLSPETTFEATDIPPIREESTLTKFARMPSEAVGKIPYVGGVAKELVPQTPAQWGGAAGLTALGLVPGVGQAAAAMKIAPFLARAGAAGIGAMGGSVAGGEREPLEIAKEGAVAGGGQMLGEAIAKPVSAAGGYLMRQLKGGTQKLLDEYGSKLAGIIPGIGGEKLTPTRFFDVVAGGKGDEALSKTYQAGLDEIKNMTGQDAFIQNPRVTQIIQRYLPDSEHMTDIGTITAPVRAAGGLIPPGQAPRAAAAPAVTQSASTPISEIFRPLPPRAVGPVAKPPIEPVVMGKSGVRGMNVTPSAQRPPISESAFPEGLSSTPSPTEQAITRNYLAPPYSSGMAPRRPQQGGTPASLVLGGAGGGQPISIDDAIKAAQEIGARSRLAGAKPEGAILGREMRQANTALRDTIADELNRIAAGAGDLYKQLNTDFRKGATALGILKDEQNKIFQQGPTGPKINISALQRAQDMALDELRKIGAEDLATAARRGAPPGAGDVTRQIPGAGLFFGGGPFRQGVSTGKIGVPSPTGAPGAEISPYISGLLGQLLTEYLERQRQQRGQPLESLGLRE